MRSQKNAEKKQKKDRRPMGNGVKALLAALLSVALASSVAFSVVAVLSAAYIERHPERFTLDLSLLRTAKSAEPPVLYYFENGSDDPVSDLDAARPLREGRDPIPRAVPLTEMPKALPDAFVAIEDKRFYTHKGVDLRRTAAAILRYLSGDRRGFGGSTITQQLVKNVTGENARTPMRKLTEILRALDLEKSLGKSEILEAYLNIVPLANGCVGVGEGASRYFGKLPRELSLAECASLAAVTQNPTRYDPEKNPAENKVRRDRILAEMLTQGYITAEECKAATETEVTTVKRETAAPRVQSWYEDLVTADVIRDLRETYGYTKEEASQLYYRGGLRVYTLVDPALQETVERYYADASHFPRLENGKAPASAMIVLDSRTGNVLAVAGAIGEKTGDRLFSFATDAKRPPGSVLKPLSVYAPALEMGRITYASVYDDVPVTFKKDKSGDLTAWPRNASGIYRGLSSVNVAVRDSLNTVPIRILTEIGIDRAFRFARNTLGITSLVEGDKSGVTDRGVAALALGQMSYGATLREITAAYTAFSNRGVYRNARSYAVVTDRSGNVLLDNRAVARRALSEGNAAVMTKMLENVTKSGTARALTLTNEVAVAGKTGTTQYSFDRWFIGYTSELLAGVWYGCEYPDSLSGIAGNPALSVFDTVMTELTHLRPAAKTFDDSSLIPVRICTDSGLLTTDICTLDPRGDRSTVAYFTRDTVPKRFCTCHTAVKYVGSGKEDGDGVLTDGSDPRPHRTVGLIRVDRRFPTEVFVTDAQYTACDPRLIPAPHEDPTLPYYATLLEEGTFPGRSYTKKPFNRPRRSTA